MTDSEEGEVSDGEGTEEGEVREEEEGRYEEEYETLLEEETLLKRLMETRKRKEILEKKREQASKKPKKSKKEESGKTGKEGETREGGEVDKNVQIGVKPREPEKVESTTVPDDIADEVNADEGGGREANAEKEKTNGGHKTNGVRGQRGEASTGGEGDRRRGSGGRSGTGGGTDRTKARLGSPASSEVREVGDYKIPKRKVKEPPLVIEVDDEDKRFISERSKNTSEIPIIKLESRGIASDMAKLKEEVKKLKPFDIEKLKRFECNMGVCMFFNLDRCKFSNVQNHSTNPGSFTTVAHICAVCHWSVGACEYHPASKCPMIRLRIIT